MPTVSSQRTCGACWQWPLFIPTSFTLFTRPFSWITSMYYMDYAILAPQRHVSVDSILSQVKFVEVTRGGRYSVFAHVSIFSTHSPHALGSRLFIWRWRQVFPMDLCFRNGWCDGEGNNGLSLTCAGPHSFDPDSSDLADSLCVTPCNWCYLFIIVCI